MPNPATRSVTKIRSTHRLHRRVVHHRATRIRRGRCAWLAYFGETVRKARTFFLGNGMVVFVLMRLKTLTPACLMQEGGTAEKMV